MEFTPFHKIHIRINFSFLCSVSLSLSLALFPYFTYLLSFFVHSVRDSIWNLFAIFEFSSFLSHFQMRESLPFHNLLEISNEFRDSFFLKKIFFLWNANFANIEFHHWKSILFSATSFDPRSSYFRIAINSLQIFVFHFISFCFISIWCQYKFITWTRAIWVSWYHSFWSFWKKKKILPFYCCRYHFNTNRASLVHKFCCIFWFHFLNPVAMAWAICFSYFVAHLDFAYTILPAENRKYLVSVQFDLCSGKWKKKTTFNAWHWMVSCMKWFYFLKVFFIIFWFCSILNSKLITPRANMCGKKNNHIFHKYNSKHKQIYTETISIDLRFTPTSFLWNTSKHHNKQKLKLSNWLKISYVWMARGLMRAYTIA